MFVKRRIMRALLVFGLFEQLLGAIETVLLHQIIDLGVHAFVVDAAGFAGSGIEQILLLRLAGLFVDLWKSPSGGRVMHQFIQVFFSESASLA